MYYVVYKLRFFYFTRKTIFFTVCCFILTFKTKALERSCRNTKAPRGRDPCVVRCSEARLSWLPPPTPGSGLRLLLALR